MPIEIREVIIKAEIRDAGEQSSMPAETGKTAEDRETLVRECVDQVLRIIADKKAR